MQAKERAAGVELRLAIEKARQDEERKKQKRKFVVGGVDSEEAPKVIWLK